jgi:benzoylformate decarboxylase
LEVLAGAGVRYIFGNPGSTELPLNDVLVGDSRFTYILALQEVPLTAMADGYAIASGGLGVASVHISPGLGNAMGMLYNAYSAGTPLLLLAGQQDRRLMVGEPVLAGDNVRVARPWTKWAAEVQRVEDVPTVMRRAVQTALTPPTGPVFLSLPVDLQLEETNGLDLTPPHVPDRRIRPPLDALRKAAELLSQAQNPAVLAGSRVTEADAGQELVALAELLGAPVLSESSTSHGRLPMPPGHPLYQGTLPLWGPEVRQQLADYDVILVAGMNLLRLYIHREPARPIPEHIRLVHLDANPWELGKNYPVEVGLLADPKAGLAELAQQVAGLLPTAAVDAARKRRSQASARRTAEQEALVAQLDVELQREPMSALALMGALSRVLPPDVAVVEEAVTTHHNVLERLGVIRDAAARIAHRGWALGWGLGCSIGVKLAWPERPVVSLLGDGSALYGIQGLWTAARHRIPVTFIIANNRQYKILKISGQVMQLPEMAQQHFLGMDLEEPEVDFVNLARSLGVAAHRVSTTAELMSRLDDALSGNEPLLLDVPIVD